MVSNGELVTMFFYGKVLPGDVVKDTTFWHVIHIHKMLVVHSSKAKLVLGELYRFVIKVSRFQNCPWPLAVI